MGGGLSEFGFLGAPDLTKSNAITVALILFKCHCFKMPSVERASGPTLLAQISLAWLPSVELQRSEPIENLLLCAQPSFSTGREEKKPALHSPVSIFLQILMLLIIYECSSTAVSNNKNHSTDQSHNFPAPR